MRVINLPFYARLALVLLALVLSFFILRIAANIFIPLVFGLLIAILLYPVCHFLERRLHMGRGAGSAVAVLLFVAALGGFMYFLIFQIVRLSGDIPLLRHRFQEMFDGLQHWLSYKFQITSRQQTSYIDKSVNNLVETAASSVSNIVLSVTGIVVLIIFILIFTFFILFHRKLLKKFVLHLFNVRHRSKVNEVILESKSMINAYVSGLLIEMVVVGVVNSTMLLCMGVPYAMLLGALSAVLNIIPYLGIYTSIAITMIMTMANGTASLAMTAGLGLFIVHLLDANILMPRIVGARVKMNPFITIVAVIIGQFTWGVPGMFLFIPVVGMVKLVCDRVEGLEAWGLLIGVDEEPKKTSPRISINKNAADKNHQ